MSMIIELRAELDEFEVRFDLYPVTGVVGAEIVLQTNFSAEEEGPTAEALEEAIEQLCADMVLTLATLGIGGHVRFMNGEDPSSEDGAAISRALANTPAPVKISREFCEEMQQSRKEEREKTTKFLGALSHEMKEEGIRRGLNKEERAEMTIGDLTNPRDEE
ncbi:MAG: hypothetical protein M3315_06845 [Actinomycetota bacterium]|nr:hypothetical protein [Actinomycetota bacterium]